MSAPMLSVSGLRKAFGGIAALRDLSFSVDRGEVLALIGPNGAGKTTCFNVIHGQLAPDAGEVRFEGRSIAGLPTHAIARRGVGRTFQVAATFASMTVRESVILALLARDRGDARAATGLLPAASPEADALLERVRIGDLANAHCAALAYGDAKRVELALALAGNPRLLLMDEPTAGMALNARREMMQLAAGLVREGRKAMLFTEHDMDIVFEFADRIIVLDRGTVVATGSPASIRANPAVQAIYLGARK
ncbi:MAG: ABC transporter ATP-binding protein [Candidatus Levyibacteriota bacterium]